MSKENYYNDVFARNYDKFTKSGYYDYKKKAAAFNKLVNGKHVLEIGIGTGALAEELLKYGYEIEGIEPSAPMIKEFNKKQLPIIIYQQDAIYMETNSKYDAIFSHGATPVAIMRDGEIYFDSYITDNNQFKQAMKQIFDHLKKRGLFLCGLQPGSGDCITVGDFYRSESKRDGDLLIKTHYFKEGETWHHQTVTERMWPEKDYAKMMAEVGFEVVGPNSDDTWYVFQKP